MVVVYITFCRSGSLAIPDMNIELWLDQYGYWAVFCGVFVEGPITLALAGLLVHQGYLNIFGVFVSALAATFMVVEISYFIGLVAGQYLLKHWPFWRRNNDRFLTLIKRCFYWASVISPAPTR